MFLTNFCQSIKSKQSKTHLRHSSFLKRIKINLKLFLFYNLNYSYTSYFDKSYIEFKIAREGLVVETLEFWLPFELINLGFWSFDIDETGVFVEFMDSSRVNRFSIIGKSIRESNFSIINSRVIWRVWIISWADGLS